eukprot:PhF_6_TR6176/c0_g1_i1/m.9238
MNPTARLTIKDTSGHHCRLRYKCCLNSARSGFKLEAIVRFAVGWISPPLVTPELPHVIHLGKGVDLSIPFVCHFTMVAIVNEQGYDTGSYLYFSGTPWLGMSVGLMKLQGGTLVLNHDTADVDVETEDALFVKYS